MSTYLMNIQNNLYMFNMKIISCYVLKEKNKKVIQFTANNIICYNYIEYIEYTENHNLTKYF